MAKIKYEDDNTYICVDLIEDEEGLILHNRDELEMKFRELLTALGFRYPQEAYDVEPNVVYNVSEDEYEVDCTCPLCEVEQ